MRMMWIALERCGKFQKKEEGEVDTPLLHRLRLMTGPLALKRVDQTPVTERNKNEFLPY